MIQTLVFVIGVVCMLLAIIFFILASTTKSSIISGQSNFSTLQKTSSNYNIVAITMLLVSVMICLPTWIYIENKN